MALLQLSDKRPRLFFDTSKSSGQPRRNCATSKAIEKINFRAEISLKEGTEREHRLVSELFQKQGKANFLMLNQCPGQLTGTFYILKNFREKKKNSRKIKLAFNFRGVSISDF